MRDAAAPSELSKDRLRVWLRLLKVTRSVEAELRERMRLGWGMTLPRFDVMAALARSGDGLKMTDLSGALRVSNGNVTGIVDRLVADGLVERRAVAGDRRAMRVSLTEAGRALFADMAGAHEGWLDGILSGADAAGLRALHGELGRIADGLDGGRA